MEQPDRFVLSANLINAILNYMSSKPYAEVAPIVNGLHSQLAPQLPQSTENNSESTEKSTE